jgi:Na+/melibiose symporter-like transporter
LRTFIWLETFFISFMLVGIQSNMFDKIAENPFKAIAGLLVVSAMSGLFIVYFPLRTLVASANSTQKEVKKLMLHDLRTKVQALEVSEKGVQKTGAGFS